jgi:hypothetical protein
MSNKYEIIYKHFDMNPEYRGYTVKYASDKNKAIRFLCPTKPDKDGFGITKKGARIQILEVNEIAHREW